MRRVCALGPAVEAVAAGVEELICIAAGVNTRGAPGQRTGRTPALGIRVDRGDGAPALHIHGQRAHRTVRQGDQPDNVLLPLAGEEGIAAAVHRRHRGAGGQIEPSRPVHQGGGYRLALHYLGGINPGQFLGAVGAELPPDLGGGSRLKNGRGVRKAIQGLPAAHVLLHHPDGAVRAGGHRHDGHAGFRDISLQQLRLAGGRVQAAKGRPDSITESE